MRSVISSKKTVSELDNTTRMPTDEYVLGQMASGCQKLLYFCGDLFFSLSGAADGTLRQQGSENVLTYHPDLRRLHSAQDERGTLYSNQSRARA